MPDTPTPPASTSSPPAPVWQVQGVAFLTIEQAQVLLAYGPLPTDTSPTPENYYQGSLDPLGGPLSLTGLVNKLLGAFSLSLPSSFPELRLNLLDLIFKPNTLVRANGQIDIAIPEPFNLPGVGLTVRNLGIERLNFNFERQQAQSGANSFIDLEAFLAGNALLPWLAQTTARVVLQSGNYAIGLKIGAPIDSAQFVKQVLGITDLGPVESFLPTFKPAGPGRPIQLFYASENITLPEDRPDEDAEATSPPTPPVISFRQGFFVQDLIIETLGYEFGVTASITNYFELTAATQAIDLGIIQIEQPLPLTAAVPAPFTHVGKTDFLAALALDGPYIQLRTDTKEVNMGANVSLGSYDFTLYGRYLSGVFDGLVQFPGNITIPGGVSIPFGPVTFRWSKEEGFRFTNFPIPEQIQQGIDFASELMEASKGQPCGELVGLFFDSTVKPVFDINIKPVLGDTPGEVGVEVGGSFKLNIDLPTGQTEEVTNIPLEPFTLTFTVPIPLTVESFLTALYTAFLQNIDKVFRALLNNAEKLAQVLAIITAVEAAEALVTKLLCYTKNVPVNSTPPSSGGGGGGGGGGPSDPIAATNAAQTLTAIANALPAVIGLIGFLASLIGWLGIKSSRQRRAERARDRARDRIRNLLTVPDFRLDAWGKRNGNTNSKFIRLAWTPIEVDEDIKYFIATKDGSRTITQNNNINKSTSGFEFGYGSMVYGKPTTVSIYATYRFDGTTYTGNPRTVSVLYPLLAQPQPSFAFNNLSNTLSLNYAAVPNVTSIPGNTIRPSKYKAAVVRPGFGGIFSSRPDAIIETYEVPASSTTIGINGNALLSKLSPGTEYNIYMQTLATDTDLHSNDSNVARLYQLNEINRAEISYDRNSVALLIRFGAPGGASAYRFKVYRIFPDPPTPPATDENPFPQKPERPAPVLVHTTGAIGIGGTGAQRGVRLPVSPWANENHYGYQVEMQVLGSLNAGSRQIWLNSGYQLLTNTLPAPDTPELVGVIAFGVNFMKIGTNFKIR